MISSLKTNEIYDKIKRIFIDKFGIQLDGCDFDVLTTDLLGKSFQLSATDLLCLFFEIEKQFNISIPQEAIVENRFRDIQNIISIIHENFVVE